MAITEVWDVKAGLRIDDRRVTGFDVSTIEARAEVLIAVGDVWAELGSVLLSGVINPIEGLSS